MNELQFYSVVFHHHISEQNVSDPGSNFCFFVASVDPSMVTGFCLFVCVLRNGRSTNEILHLHPVGGLSRAR